MSERYCLIGSNNYGYRILISGYGGITIEGVAALIHLNLVGAGVPVRQFTNSGGKIV